MVVSPDGDLDLSGSPKIEMLANPGARGGLGLNTAHFKAVSGKLFPQDPSPSDIKQQAIGDCYLLAGVLAILARPGGGETIARLMKEVGGRVVVRFYDNTGAARYVSVEKSIRKNEEKHNGGAIWATLLEKAYAAAAFVEENKASEKRPGNVVAGYAKINAGGHSSDVFRTLLGGSADNKDFFSGSFDGNPGTIFQSMWVVDDAAKLDQARIAKIIQGVFEGNGELWTKYLHWRTQLVKDSWKTLLDAHGDIKNEKDEHIRRKLLRQEDLDEFFRKFALDGECVRKVMDYIENNKLLPGKRGTGVYNAGQLRNFDRIKKALAANQPVALRSLKEVGSATTGKGRSAGEDMAKGLVGLHVYAVLSVREDAAPPFLKWIRVRNPWGDTGREYYASPQNAKVLKARETKAGEFDLELSDLTKRFDSIYVGGVAIAA
ncbi:MAG TPA: C2 family cysteine protease [Terriglobales bacterium]|nr:C2 family cysteine protease [Terriglobales bacterium]